jgi:hypothetical protein
MSIENSSILVGGTVATTGGTATGLLVKGENLNEKRCILDNASDFLAQTKVNFSTKEPTPSSKAPNGYTQRRSTVYIQDPLVLDNGNLTNNTVTITIACDPETDSSEVAALRVLAAQAVHSSDFDEFWNSQSLT